MVTSNRQVKTDHNANQDMVTLVAKKDGRFNGKEVYAGKVVKCTKSEARRILAIDKSMFEIRMD